MQTSGLAALCLQLDGVPRMLHRRSYPTWWALGLVFLFLSFKIPAVCLFHACTHARLCAHLCLPLYSLALSLLVGDFIYHPFLVCPLFVALWPFLFTTEAHGHSISVHLSRPYVHATRWQHFSRTPSGHRKNTARIAYSTGKIH